MKVERRRALTVALGAAILLSGCAVHSNDQLMSREALDTQTEASARIAESAARAADAQQELARIQTARTVPVPAPVDEDLGNVPPDLRRLVTVEWSGPAPEAAKRVAEIVGWEFRVVGNAPASGAMVDINIRERPAAKALEDIGLQAQPFGQIVADPTVRRIEFRYLHTTRQVVPGSSAWTGRATMTK